MVDYRKFDKIDVSDDEEEPVKGKVVSTTTVRINKNCFGCGKLDAKNVVFRHEEIFDRPIRWICDRLLPR